MKNKKILYLLTTILTLFSFNMNANAAQELTCVYEKGAYVDKVILIQHSTGERVIYTNQDDVSKDSANWEKKENYYIGITPYLDLDDDENLITCPKFSKLFNDEKGERVVFYNFEYDFGYKALDEKESSKTVENVEGLKTTIPKKVSDPKNDMLIDLDGNKYTGSCKYKRTLESGRIHYIQVNFGRNDVLVTEYDPEKGEYSGLKNHAHTINSGFNSNAYVYQFGLNGEFSVSYFLKNDGDCLDELFVQRHSDSSWVSTDWGIHTNHTINTTILTNDSKGVTYILDMVSGTNPITEETLTLNTTYGDDIKFVSGSITNCKDLLGDKIYGYFNVIWNIVKIGIPIILVGFGTIDFAQAIFSGKEDGMKKAQAKFMKRIIIAVVIFVVPTLLGFLLKIANSVWENIGTDICGIIF